MTKKLIIDGMVLDSLPLVGRAGVGGFPVVVDLSARAEFSRNGVPPSLALPHQWGGNGAS